MMIELNKLLHQFGLQGNFVTYSPITASFRSEFNITPVLSPASKEKKELDRSSIMLSDQMAPRIEKYP